MTIECLSQLTQKLCKEAEGCSMGSPLSVALANIQAIWIKNHLVKPLKSVFYKIYVGGIYSHSSIWFLGIRIVWGQKFQAKTKRKIDANYSFILIIFNKFLLYLTNIIFIQHVFFFQNFWPQTDLYTPKSYTTSCQYLQFFKFKLFRYFQFKNYQNVTK